MRRLAVGLIRFYQKYISANTPPSCKYYPTCSCYGIEAIERFGFIKGSALTLWRILRCNPWSTGGYDPVPQKKSAAKGRRRKREYKFIEYKAVKSRKKK